MKRYFFDEKCTCSDIIKVPQKLNSYILIVGDHTGNIEIIHINDLENEENDLEKRFFSQKGHFNKVNSIQIIKENSLFVSGGDDKQMIVWNIKGEILRKITTFKSEVTNILIFPRIDYLLKSTGFLNPKDHQKFINLPFQKFVSKTEHMNNKLRVTLKKTLSSNYSHQAIDDDNKKETPFTFINILSKCDFMKNLKIKNKNQDDQKNKLNKRNNEKFMDDEDEQNNETYKEMKTKIAMLENMNKELLDICCKLDDNK